jgi:hypothetical protein
LYGKENYIKARRTLAQGKYKDKTTKFGDQAFKDEQWSMYERLKEMERIMQEQECVLASQKEV